MYYGKPFKMPSAYDPTPPCEYVTEVRPNKAREKEEGVMGEPKPMPSYWALAEEVTHLQGKLGKLQVENAKLRELVRHALTFCVNGYCSEYEGCMWTIGGKSECSFADRAKKLGVVG